MENKEDKFWELAESTILKCTKHDEFLSEMKKHFKYIRTASQRFMVGDSEIMFELSDFWHKNKSKLVKVKVFTKKDLEKVSELIDDLYFDYDRMSTSGQETIDKISSTLKELS